MFEFTREFIINEPGRISEKDGVLVVKKMVNLKAKNITSVSHKSYEDPVNESVTLDLSGVKAADPVDANTFISGAICRLVVTITEEGRVTALVNDQYPTHKKQYFYEGLSEVAHDSVALGAMPIDTWVNQAIREADHEQEDRLISVTKSNNGKLVISANDPYTRIAEIRIVQVPAYDRTAAQAMTGYQDYQVLYLGNKANQFKTAEVTPTLGTDIILGSLGAGTVSHILKDMRLLTAANITPYGLNRDERPIPGGKYDQFNIEYVVEERNKNHNVFGSIAHTLTTHIFFVESGAVSDFATVLTTLGLTIDEIGPKDISGSTISMNPDATLPEPVIAMAKDVEATAASIPTTATTVVDTSALKDSTNAAITGTATATTTLS